MKVGRGVLYVFVLAVLVLCLSVISIGQAVNATLLGTVTDKTGAVLPDAKVKITSSSYSAQRTNVISSYEKHCSSRFNQDE